MNIAAKEIGLGPTAASVAHEVATMLEREANVRAVFGAPVKLDTRIVIPVARVACGGGGASVDALGVAVDTIRRFFRRKDAHVTPSRTFVGGGGGGIDVRPVGFLCEEDGRVVFVRIEDERSAHDGSMAQTPRARAKSAQA